MFARHDMIDRWGPVDARALYISYWYEPVVYGIRRRYNISWPEMFCVFRDEQLTIYWRKEEMRRCGLRAIEDWLVPSSRREQLWREYQGILKDLKLLARQTGKISVASPLFTVRSLILRWKKSLDAFWSLVLVPEVANFAAPFYIEERLRAYVPEKELPAVLQILLAPERLSFHQQAEYELWRLAARSRDAEQRNRFLARYAAKWFWLDTSYYEVADASSGDFMERIRRVTKAKAGQKRDHLKNYPHTVRQKKKEVVKKYGIPRDISRDSSTLAFSIWWQDHRKGVTWWVSSQIRHFCRYAVSYFSIDYKVLMYYTFPELVRLFQTGRRVSATEIERRKKLYVIELSKRVRLSTGSEASALERKILSLVQATSSMGKLKGIVTCRSDQPVVGTARIVLSPRQAAHFQTGDILVTPMTSPDFVPLMRRARGVITDVGGLMSHAAVVSRELKVPCIVGTNAASRILKNGDRVIMDTTSGIITRQ